MNLTGSQLYSRAVRGLRSPSKHLLDQQFRLIFLYPMLFDKRLHGNFSNIMRGFLSVSMLKEIFVNNALNIVAIASKDHPLVDEQGKKLDVQQMVKGSIVSSSRSTLSADLVNYGGQVNVAAPRFPIDSHTLQQKIQEKTANIKEYLVSDPRTKKLNAYVEIITLDNMIDVPVIVGTRDFSIDTLSLAFVLAVALALKKPLNSWANAQFVFSVIENTNQEDAWSLFTNLVEKRNSTLTQRLVAWLAPDHPYMAGMIQKISRNIPEPKNVPGARIISKIPVIGRPFRDKSKPQNHSPSKVKRYGAWTGSKVSRQFDPGELRDEDLDIGKSSGQKYVGVKGGVYEPEAPFKSESKFDILKIVKSNMSETKLYFKFMLDDNLLRNQFGLDKSPGQMRTAFSRVSEEAKIMLKQSHQTFMSYMGQNVDSVMAQTFWTIHPWDTDVDYTRVRDEIIDAELNEDIAKVIEDLGGALSDTFGSGDSEEAMKRTRIVNKLCDKNLESTYEIIGNLGKFMEDELGKIRSNIFTGQQFQRFYEGFDEVTRKFNSVNVKLRHQMESAVKGSNDIFDQAVRVISKSLDKMLDAYRKNYVSAGNVTPGVTVTNPIDNFSNIALRMNNLIDSSLVPDYLNQIRDGLLIIILAHFYAAAMSAICSFMSYIDVEVETVSNDALDLPNYTLVVPVETIAMLHSAVISKSWRDLVSRGNTQHTNLTDNYVKGVVSFINKRLDVPNLIVIDEKKGDIFYKLQYMSSVNKSNINTFKTYINSMTKNELKEQGNLY